MNLEDRLRSHMHSGDELFLESASDVGVITAAGRRRTRRNQVGGAAAGGVLALGLVFGIATQIGDDGPEEVANPSTEAAITELDMAESSAMTDAASAPADLGESERLAEGIELAPAVVAYEVIVGVGDGFAGLRATANGVAAIRSDDGLEWTETATSGLPDGADISGLVYDDGVFAAPFVVFDEVAARSISYIGTSSDLVGWSVEALDFGEEFSDPFLSDVVLSNGDVVAVAMVSPPFEQSEELVEVSAPSIFTIRGPVGGPYDATALTETGFGIGGLRAAGAVVMFTVFTDEGADVWASDGATWTIVRSSSSEEFPSLGGAGSEMYLVGSATVERSGDAGSTWTELAVPTGVGASSSSASVVSSADNIAVLFSLRAPDGQNDGYVLASATGGALVEASLEGLVPDRAFVHLVAVNDEEALLEVFPEPEVVDEELAASSGLIETPDVADGESGSSGVRYVRVPLS